MKNLHISHTDIRSDSRILKEMNCLSRNGYFVNGIGVQTNDGSKRSDFNMNTEILTVQLFARKLSFLPKILKHILVFLEMMIKIILPAILTKPIIVHCHDISVLPIAVIVKVFTKARLIYDAHELESDRNGITKLQSWLILQVERLLWRFVDALIVVSPSIDVWYQDKIGPKLSAIVLNSPLISEETLCESDYLRSKFSIPFDSKTFIYVGILASGRGIDLLTQAFSYPTTTSHLVLLGYGDLADELRQLSSKNFNIHFHEAVPHADVVSIVQSADFGLCMIQNVSLSDYYCLPNKLFEYCFAGVPVLASDFPDIRAVLSQYGIGECCSLEPEAFREAVHSLQTSDKKFEFADLTPLSWQAQEQKLIKLYQGLL